MAVITNCHLLGSEIGVVGDLHNAGLELGDAVQSRPLGGPIQHLLQPVYGLYHTRFTSKSDPGGPEALALFTAKSAGQVAKRIDPQWP